MSEFVKLVLSSAGTAALITGIIGIIRWAIERKASQKDGEKESMEKRIGEVEERMDKRDAKMDAIMAGVRSLLYSEIKDRCKEAIAAGEISVDDLEDLSRNHELYHGPLEGNGYLDALMTKVRALPVRE